MPFWTPVHGPLAVVCRSRMDRKSYRSEKRSGASDGGAMLKFRIGNSEFRIGKKEKQGCLRTGQLERGSEGDPSTSVGMTGRSEIASGRLRENKEK